MNTVDDLVAGYLARLEEQARVLPADRRAELLAEIREHISDARAAGAAADEAAVRTLLDRLGEPSDIVAAAREDVPVGWGAPPPPPRGTGLELAAVLLLTAGSFFPVIGWLVGVVLLWISSLWRVREKLLGTLVVPLGPGGILLWGAVVPGATCSSSTETFPDGTTVLTSESCTGFVLPWPLAVLVAVAVLAGPIVVAVVLMRIARRRADEPAP